MTLFRQSSLAAAALTLLVLPASAQGRGRGGDSGGRGEGRDRAVLRDSRGADAARPDDHRRDGRALAEARANAAAQVHRDERARDERARDERARDERARDERARDQRARNERGRDERGRDERGRDERARSEARARTEPRNHSNVRERDYDRGNARDMAYNRAREAERARAYGRTRGERWLGERRWRDDHFRVVLQWFAQPRYYYVPRYAYARLPYGWEDAVYEDAFFPPEYDAWCDDVPVQLEYLLPPVFRGHRRLILGDRLIVIDRVTRNILLVIRL